MMFKNFHPALRDDDLKNAFCAVLLRSNQKQNNTHQIQTQTSVRVLRYRTNIFKCDLKHLEHTSGILAFVEIPIRISSPLRYHLDVPNPKEVLRLRQGSLGRLCSSTASRPFLGNLCQPMPRIRKLCVRTSAITIKKSARAALPECSRWNSFD